MSANSPHVFVNAGHLSMQLDALTLMAAGSFVATISGLLLLGAWTQIRSAPALLWWSAANFVDAIAIGGLATGFATAQPLTVTIATGLLVVVPPLVWGGTRCFVGRGTPLIALAAGPVAWLAVAAAPLPISHEAAAAGASFVVWIAYLAATNVELWRGRAEPLRARWPLIAFFTAHALVFLAGIADLFAGELPSGTVPPLSSLFSFIHFEHLIYAIGTAIFMVVLCKERIELRYINAAHVDSLTGVANRRAFFDSAERVFRRCRENGAPVAMIMFDLDRFKSVNDTDGHRTGDAVLRLFADTARGLLRPSDLFGRYGGEEFVVVLPNTTIDAAFVIAERVRRAFAEACRPLDGLTIGATVSAGVAAGGADATLDETLIAADKAMYRAKTRGRNRVERADEGGGAEDGTKIARIA
ncbi:MAG: GGDEF domain-containing protein [Bauldia sp.]